MILDPNPQKYVSEAKSRFWAQMTIFTENALLSPKVIFWRQVRFSAESAPWKMHESLYPLAEIHSGPDRTPKKLFLQGSAFLLQKRICAQRCTFCKKSAQLSKKHTFCPLSADAYKINCLLMKMYSLFTEKLFWSKSALFRENRAFSRVVSTNASPTSGPPCPRLFFAAVQI